MITQTPDNSIAGVAEVIRRHKSGFVILDPELRFWRGVEDLWEGAAWTRRVKERQVYANLTAARQELHNMLDFRTKPRQPRPLVRVDKFETAWDLWYEQRQASSKLTRDCSKKYRG